MKLSSPKIKKFLTFSQEKVFLIFQETKPRKNFLYFLKKSFSYISGNGNPKFFFYISGNGTFLCFRKGYSEPWHNGTFLYFGKGILKTLT